jgi:hypothetical protein
VAKRFTAGLLVSVWAASACYGQSAGRASNVFEIGVPPGVPSEALIIRYFLTGAFNGYAGWMTPRPNLNSYAINTVHEGSQAMGIKAIVYARGCAIQTLSRSLPDQRERDYTFACRELPDMALTGTLTKLDRLIGKDFDIHVNYVAYWAQTFFGPGAGPLVTTLPVGVTSPDANGKFRVSLPDFSQDPTASSPDHEGTFQFQVREKSTGNLLAQLVPGELKARSRGLRITGKYPDELVFAPCLASTPVVPLAFTTRFYDDTCK